jgi:hypothetical protein
MPSPIDINLIAKEARLAAVHEFSRFAEICHKSRRCN